MVYIFTNNLINSLFCIPKTLSSFLWSQIHICIKLSQKRQDWFYKPKMSKTYCLHIFMFTLFIQIRSLKRHLNSQIKGKFKVVIKLHQFVKNVLYDNINSLFWATGNLIPLKIRKDYFRKFKHENNWTIEKIKKAKNFC